jgi:hypothetical protein
LYPSSSGTEDVSIENCTVEFVGGNGVFLSNHAWRTSVSGNVVRFTGDSAILLVGSTELMNGTRLTYPSDNNITDNLCHDMGFYGGWVISERASVW